MRMKEITLSLILFIFIFPEFVSAMSEKEIKYGNYTDRLVISGQPVLFNDLVDKQINEIGNKIAKASGEDMKYTFRVLNDPTINAYSAAGGFIYINTGLLDILESEDELAALLAHEIHHTNDSHQINSVYTRHVTKIAGIAGGLAIGGGLAALGASALGPAPNPNYAPSLYNTHMQLMSEVTDLGVKAGMTMGDAMADSMIRGYGKEQELEADRFAVQYTHKAGYNPNALIGVFKKLQSIKNKLGINANNYISSLINAEPGLEERIKKAEEFILNPKNMQIKDEGGESQP